ncbi:tetratricopeptide repeat protein 25-like [Bradysia coprophila]|uniref:tetratricopeptide repeat protein 25-like n=1 Tax=Bradysia coprophila TaxID=38358 RepID=UPI00187DD3DA|nr:tetratricopeptide repeat protein 25-like [Bradysia coprophila]
MTRKKVVDPQDEIDTCCKLLCDEASNHMKVRNYHRALNVYNKALELNPSDQNALVARSKCYLLLGDPAKGLEDAETALSADKSNIRAIYQKAESLYFLGQFEHSLMFFHRGLKLRPELNSFRLGVQKSQEAIEKTIGGFPKKPSKPSSSKPDSGSKLDSASKPDSSSKPESSSKPASGKSDKHSSSRSTQPKVRPRTAKVSAEKREARKLLGELCVDKEYLENLLKHPDLKRADNGAENISSLARDAVQFLNNRQEFWRQQRPCTAAPKKTKIIDTPLPKWYT